MADIRNKPDNVSGSFGADTSHPTRGILFRMMMYLLLFLAATPAIRAADDRNSDGKGKTRSEEVAGEKLWLDEIRNHNQELRRSLTDAHLLMTSLKEAKGRVERSVYPAVLADLIKPPSSHSNAIAAHSYFTGAFPSFMDWEYSSAPKTPQSDFRDIQRELVQSLPPPPDGKNLEASLERLKDHNFLAVKVALIGTLDGKIKATTERIDKLRNDLALSDKKVGETSTKFWRSISGREKEDITARWVGLTGLFAMAAAAILGVSILFWLGKSATLPGHFIEYLRWNPLLDLTTVFLLTITIVILGLNKELTSEVLGTLIGGISGYVLGRASRASSAAQAQEIREIVRGTGSTAPSHLNAEDIMETLGAKYVLPDDLKARGDSITLGEIISHFKKVKHDRVIIFQNEEGGNVGSARGILTRAAIDNFTTKDQLPAGKDDLTLGHFLADPEYAELLCKSAVWVSPSEPLDRATTKLAIKTQALGEQGSCLDLLVTENGLPQEKVIGLITGEALQRKAKI